MFQKLRSRLSNLSDSDDELKAENQTELTSKEIDFVRNTWSLLRNDIARFKFLGGELFVRFFTKYPDYQRQFKSFKDVPMDFQRNRDIRFNKKLMAHGTYVMYTIGMLVDNLERPLMMEQMLKRLARNHYRRKISLIAFDRLRNTFLEHLAEILGTKIFTKKVSIAWSKAFNYLLMEIEKNFKILESDLERSGSYYRLNSMHLAARNDLVRLQRLKESGKKKTLNVNNDCYESSSEQNLIHQRIRIESPAANIKQIRHNSQCSAPIDERREAERSKSFLTKTISFLRKNRL
ncbi:Globin [Sarcoptes scabiei]|nr:Globin [Sarcoptes scabiei]